MNDDRTFNKTHVHHEEAPSKERKGFNWLPLLLLPLIFAGGWGMRDALGDNSENRGMEYGVGGGPGVPCTSTSPN